MKKYSVVHLLFVILLLSVTQLHAASDEKSTLTQVISPDGKIEFSLVIDGFGTPYYSVKLSDETVVLDSRLGIRFEKQAAFDQGLQLVGSRTASKDETWEQPWGERRLVRDFHNELLLEFADDGLDQVFDGDQANGLVFDHHHGQGSPLQLKMKHGIMQAAVGVDADDWPGQLFQWWAVIRFLKQKFNDIQIADTEILVIHQWPACIRDAIGQRPDGFGGLSGLYGGDFFPGHHHMSGREFAGLQDTVNHV